MSSRLPEIEQEINYRTSVPTRLLIFGHYTNVKRGTGPKYVLPQSGS